MPLIPPLTFSSPSQRAPPTFGAQSHAQRSLVPDNATETSSSEGSELAFLEYITCSICHYPLQSDQPRDFWITSCAHILCSNQAHKHKAQHCTYCYKTPIETFLVNSELPEDLRRWLQPTRTSITSISDTLSILYFQNRELSRLVRHLREENERKTIEAERCSHLQRELDEMKLQLARVQVQGQDPAQPVESYEPPARVFGQYTRDMPPPPIPTSSHTRKRRRDQDGSFGNLTPPRMGNLTPSSQRHEQAQISVTQRLAERPGTSTSIRKLSQYAYQPEEARASSARPQAHSTPPIQHPQPRRLPPPPIRAMPMAPPTPSYTQSVRVVADGRQTIPLMQIQGTPRSVRTLPRMNGTPQRFVPGSRAPTAGQQSGFRRASEM